MGFFDRFTQEKEITFSDTLLTALIHGEDLAREQVKSIPQVAADIDLISSTFAMIPFRLYRRTVEDGQPQVKSLDTDSRVELLNGDTGDTLDAYQMKKALCEDYFLGYNGGGYAYIDKEGNHVKAIRYVKSEDVGFFSNDDPIFREYDISVNAVRYPEYDFLKLLRNTRNGIYGESIVKEVNEALQAAFAIITFQVKTLKKGGNKRGFLQSEKKLGDSEIKLLKESWRSLYSESGERAAVLNNGVTFKESSESATELQLNQSKVTLDKEIDTLFHMSDDYDKFIKRAVIPIATAFEISLNKVLLREKEKGELYWAADYSELLKASMKDRFEAYKQAKETGWLMINEIREMENLEAVEGMNVLNVGLGAALYNVDTEEYYVPNTDTAENREAKEGGQPDNTEGDAEDE